MKVSVKENRIQCYLEAHYRLHFGLYALSGMPLVQEIIEGAWLRCAPTPTRTTWAASHPFMAYPFSYKVTRTVNVGAVTRAH
jgi:DNA-binding GntR family transcriptional regulator